MTDDEPARRRDSTATKAAILAAARELFVERGFDRTTVRDIASLAGANQALLFRYFGSKEALFRDAMTSHSEQLIAETPPEQLVARVLARMLAPEAARAHDNPLFALLRSGGYEQIADLYRDSLGGRYRQVLARLTDSDDAEIRADLVLAWLLGIGLLRSVFEHRPLSDADPTTVATHVLRAVATMLERVDPRPAD